jgi:hypothetical protein
MRNLLVILVLSCTALTSQAQVDLKINPIGTIFGSPDLSAEFAANEQFGIELVVGPVANSFNLTNVDFKRRGFVGYIAGKYYINPDRGMDNLSIGVYAKNRFVNYNAEVEEEVDENFQRNKIALGFLVSQKWVSDNNLVFGIDAGLGRTISNRYKYDNENQSSVDLAALPFLNFDGILRLSVGYRFGGNNLR